MQQQLKTSLSKYPHNEYHPGRNNLVCFLWYFINLLVLKNPFNPVMFIKRWVLKLFGATLGKSVVIKPSVSIKYPWRLQIGDHSWVGEHVWIDNLDNVVIGPNCCLSQGAMLLTGSHDFSRVSFNVQTAPIVLEEGVWIGTKATVALGVRCKSHAILGINSTTLKDLEPYSIYYGNPAVKIAVRHIYH